MGRTGREGRSEVRVGGAIVPNQYEACAYRMSVDLVLKQGYLVKAPTSVGHREYSGKAETVLSVSLSFTSNVGVDRICVFTGKADENYICLAVREAQSSQVLCARCRSEAVVL